MQTLTLIDKKTGEAIDLNQMIKDLTDKLPEMKVDEISKLLTNVNQVSRVAGKIESKIKSHIKETPLEFDREDTTYFGDWRLKRYNSFRFNEKRFRAEASPEEIEFYEKIKDKYSTLNEIIKFG